MLRRSASTASSLLRSSVRACVEVRLSTGELRGEPLGVGDRRLHPLPSRGAGAEERFLTAALGARARHVGLDGLRAGLRGGDLRLRLIDAGEGALNARVLQRALPPVVFERRLRRVNRGGGLRDLRPVVVVLQADQLVALPNLLIVIHLHFAHETRDLRAERRDIAADERVVGDLIDSSSFPRIPVARQRERDRERHQHDEHGRAESPPGGLQRIDRVFNLRARGRDDWGCGHFERPPCERHRSKARTDPAARSVDADSSRTQSAVSVRASVRAATHLSDR